MVVVLTTQSKTSKESL